MINESAVFIRDEVRSYLKTVAVIPRREDVLLGNIAALEGNSVLSDRIIITLVNIEEESSLKNGKNWSRNPLTGGIETALPPVYLNLYLLFTATLPESAGETDGPYTRALERISKVIEFFQSKKVFTLQSSPGFDFSGLEENLVSQIRLIPELYTLTFEQINHLWGSLGGKQSPFVMYKIRMVKIQGSVSTETPLVESIDTEVDSWKPNT